MKLFNKILFLFVVLLFANTVVSQTLLTPTGFQTDFEDTTDYVNWSLNTGSQGKKCANKWFFGKAGANLGEAGLFISPDSGITASYQSSGVSVVACREFTFDEGLYELSFDWKAGGSNIVDGLYVCWIPKSLGPLNSISTSNLQNWVSKNALYFGRDSLRLYQRSWNTIADTIRSDGTPHYLAFVWNNGVSGVTPPAACIDNILIMEYGRCDKPQKLAASPKGNDMVLSWQGSADAYDVMCKNNITGDVIEYRDVTTTSQIISDLPEGHCTYYVRSKCSGLSGAWVSLDKFLFYPGTRCIDFFSLGTRNCYIGSTFNPRDTREYVDFGHLSIASRHTIHWDPNEVDPRTVTPTGGLKTVPEGEIGSVRLGNWDTGAQAECIEYNYIVDTTKAAVLVLNYAVVLQDVNPPHDSAAQPRFNLEIRHKNKLLPYGCGEARFSSGFNTSTEEGWHKNAFCWWKDWTKVSINLGQYHGESLNIRLTTLDCTETGHYGYAYFTLACIDGKIKGLSCGDSPTNKFEGPEGFKYRWYLPNNPLNIVSTDRILEVPSNDTLTYYLDVIQPTNINCFYTLTASAVGRWPVAKASYKHEVIDCQNIVTFTNESYVRRINQITKDSAATNEPCETFFWDFGDGEVSHDENLVHIFPAEGGTYEVKLSAGITGGCEDITTFVLNLPDVSGSVDSISAVVCEGMPYEFAGKNLFNSGVYVDSALNIYGCDSIVVLDLLVADRYDTLVYDTICSTDLYYFDGKPITKTGIYKASLQSMYGCDSLVTLDILVYESMIIDIDSVVVACQYDEEIIIPYDLHSGLLREFTFYLKDKNLSVLDSNLQMIDNSFVIKMPENLEPNKYEVEIGFGKQSCGKESENIILDLRYSNDIVVQRWNDVLAVKNEDYNGGYQFVAFQWYKNGTPIVGATSSILYEEDGLDLDAEYAVLLTRMSDNFATMTCVADLFDFSSAQEDQIVVFAADQHVGVQSPQVAHVNIWSTNGILLAKEQINEGYNSIGVALNKGVYIFEFIFGDNQRKIEQVVVK